jgi:hypothetical protein
MVTNVVPSPFFPTWMELPTGCRPANLAGLAASAVFATTVIVPLALLRLGSISIRRVPAARVPWPFTTMSASSTSRMRDQQIKSPAVGVVKVPEVSIGRRYCSHSACSAHAGRPGTPCPGRRCRRGCSERGPETPRATPPGRSTLSPGWVHRRPQASSRRCSAQAMVGNLPFRCCRGSSSLSGVVEDHI